MAEMTSTDYGILRLFAYTAMAPIYAVSMPDDRGGFDVKFLSRKRARQAISDRMGVLLAACEPGGQVFTNN